MKNVFAFLFTANCHLLLAFIIASCSSCSSQNLQKGAQTLAKPTEQMHRLLDESPQETPGVLIAGTTNLYGEINTETMSYPKQVGHDLQIRVGGLLGLQTYIQKLNQLFQDRLILLDAGRKLYSSDHPRNNEIVEFYQRLPYQGLTATPIEREVFDEFLDPDKKDLPLLASNYLNIKSGDPVEDELLEGHRIVQRGGMKVGILGLVFPSALEDSSWEDPGRFFEDPVLTVLKKAEEAQKEELDHLIAIVHGGKTQDLQRFLSRLPPKTLSLVVAGGDYAGPKLLEGTPILNNQGRSQYISLKVLRPKTDGPSLATHTVRLCEKFYTATKDCYLPEDRGLLRKRIEKLEKSNFAVKKARFLGETIHFEDPTKDK